MEKLLTSQEQINGLNQIFNILISLQNKLPGENYKIFEDLKNAVAQINNSIVKQQEKPKEINGQQEIDQKDLEQLASAIV